MGLEKGLRPTSPVHVHVEDDIPVHVHVKSKGKKSKKIPSVGGPVRSSLAKKSTAASRARSKSPGGSWVPPPGRATKGTKLSWQGPTHRLEVHTPRDSLRMSDLSSGEEDQVHDQMRNYEKKIDNLLTEVGTLKNEVELQKSLKEIERQDELLEETRNVLSEQEKELDDCKDELDVSIHENRILKKSLNMLSDEMDYSRSEALALTGEREKLMKKLIEVEMDGQAAIKQMGELRDAVRRLREENRMSNTDCNRLAKQKDLLLEKLSDFESTNRTLRRLLRDQHYAETAAIRVAEQRDHLLRKLSENDRTNELSNEEEKNLNETSPESLEQDFESFESRHFCSSTKIGTSKEQKESPELATKLSGSEAPKQSGFAKTFDIEQLRIELLDNERLINDLRAQIAAFRDENASQISLQQSLESTRAHLQKQLRTKDADCNRMAVQIRTLEGQRAQDKIEIDHLQELLSTAKDKADRDKEALKKATRVQKQRATRSEDAMEQLNAQLLEKESQLEDLRTQLEQAMPRCDKMAKEKAQIQAENSALKTRLGELESLLDRVENNTKVHQENVHQELHQREAEIVGLKTENERLKCSISTIEEKFKAADTELIQLRGNIREYENLIDEYKSQISRSRQEADDTLLRLEDAEREKEIAEQDGHYELEKVKARLQNRLQELEPLPEMLKTTELRLHDANERMLMYERKNSENTKLIAELTTKVEHVSDTLEQMRGKCHDTQDENRLLQGKIDTLERKLSDADDHARELMTSVAKAEEAAHQQNLRLEEKARENASLTRQLENALSDLRRQSDQNREKSAQKERTLQTRISDLESQLSQCRAEMARLKREKEENERKFNSRLYDLKDRLEQSHSTNRSMQNYVQFLKNSYANVFGESSMSYPSTPIGGDPGNLH